MALVWFLRIGYIFYKSIKVIIYLNQLLKKTVMKTLEEYKEMFNLRDEEIKEFESFFARQKPKYILLQIYQNSKI